MPDSVDAIVASPRLPSLPAAALRLVELVQSEDVSLDQLAEVISTDPALAAKFLQVANSSFYARSQPAARVRDALVVLGLRAAKPLALGFSLVGQTRGADGSGFDYTAFWSRSLLAATVARSVARASRAWDPEEAFLGGLLHGLGVVAMARALASRYDAVYTSVGDDPAELVRREHEAFGFDHRQVGHALADRWLLPPSAAAAMDGYVTGETENPAFAGYVRCVALGARGARVFFEPPGSAPALSAFVTRCEVWLGIGPDASSAMLETAHDEASALGELLDLPQLGPEAAAEILVQANEALQRLSLAAMTEAADLEREKAGLALRASTDALTGVATRGYLDACLQAEVEDARRTGSPLSVVFLDLDHFKSVNDTYGHRVGDRVLVETARALRESLRGSDILGRYGGEEFLVVCPRSHLQGAATLARRLRQAVAAVHVVSDSGDELRVTVSAGVASFIPGVHAGAGDLVAAADRGLYAAKAAGRNTVRIGGPAAEARPAA